MARQVFFSSHDSGRGAGVSSCCGKLFALSEFSGELDHDKDGKLMLSLRSTVFAGEKCRVLSLTCFHKTTTDCLSAIHAWLRLIRDGFMRSLLAGQICLNSGP
jgi:hypothetical protein